MAQLAEVALAQPEQRGAVELRVAPDVVVRVRMEFLAVLVPPLFLRAVAALEHDRLSVPVLLLARHVVAALEQQDAFAGGSEAVGQRAAARAGADDDDVVVVHARLLRSAVAIMRGAGEWFQTPCPCGRGGTTRRSSFPLSETERGQGVRT